MINKFFSITICALFLQVLFLTSCSKEESPDSIYDYDINVSYMWVGDHQKKQLSNIVVNSTKELVYLNDDFYSYYYSSKMDEHDKVRWDDSKNDLYRYAYSSFDGWYRVDIVFFYGSLEDIEQVKKILKKHNCYY